MFKPITLAAALAAAYALPSAWADDGDTPTVLPDVSVTATPFGNDESNQILTPAKVLFGDELHDKQGTTIGDTLSHEMGVSQSAFGAGASRPVIRGLQGPRIKMLQNGMSVDDLSSLSDDHTVATDDASAQQIEILRGPAALMYGSGAIGGLINVVNQRIPTLLLPKATGEAELRFGSADNSKQTSVSVDGAVNQIGLHFDGNYRDTSDYRIPGNANLNDPSSASGHLPNSFTHQDNLGFGVSYIADWGYIGTSVGTIDSRYGIPTPEQSFIKMSQTRNDVDLLINNPWSGIESFRFRIGRNDYQHTENQKNGTPVTNFNNRATETRWEFTHLPLAGWKGTFGVQTENINFSALSAATGTPDTVPQTKSSSAAAFVIEERDFGPVRASAGGRLENVKRDPNSSTLSNRDFTLGSYSVGAAWTFTPGYSVGTTLATAERAPAIEELYSQGPHDATATFDIGDQTLRKERSRNLELSLQKTEGKLRWKANAFENRVRDFIYGRSGNRVDDTGTLSATGEFTQRFWSQGNATIHGAEAEVTYNWHGDGMSSRAFFDTSRGRLDDLGNLPLQPATRIGTEIGYRQGPWRTGASLIHAQTQGRLASFETFATPAYNQLDAYLSYTQQYGTQKVTWFANARNLLNQDIRASTSLLRESVPLPGRNLILGVRTQF